MAAYQEQSSPLLDLPAELRNQIYGHVAYNSKEIVVLAHDYILSVPLPLGQVSRQLRQEFNGVYDAIPLDQVTRFTILNNNFCIWELILSLGKIPSTPAIGVDRTIVLQTRLTNSLTSESLQTLVKTIAGEIAEAPATMSIVRTMQYEVVFDKTTFNVDAHRVTFARLAKKYRFHHPDGEQRVFEKIYWSWAEQAEKADGVSVRQYALGYWKRRDGGFSFI